MLQNINRIEWLYLSEAVFVLMRETHGSLHGESMISLLKGRRPSSCLYTSPSHINVKHKERSTLYWLALGAEEVAEDDLRKRLKTAKIRGRGTEANGIRREISEEDWLSLYINIPRNELLSQLSDLDMGWLRQIKIRISDVLKISPGSIARIANAAEMAACRHWLVAMRGIDEIPPIKDELEKQASHKFNVSSSQFRDAYETAAVKMPNENWGRSGRPRKS